MATSEGNNGEPSNQIRLPDLSGLGASLSAALHQGEEGVRNGSALPRLPELSTEAQSEAASKNNNKVALRKVKRKQAKKGKFLSNLPARQADEASASRYGSRRNSAEDAAKLESRRGSRETAEGALGLLRLPGQQAKIGKGPPRAASRLDGVSRANSPGGFLPKVRGATTSIVEDHPFFKGVSEEFRQEIVPHVSKRHLGENVGNSRQPDMWSFERPGGMLSQSFASSQLQSAPAEARELLKQSTYPTNEFDGLLLTDPRFDADIEVLFDGHIISVVRSSATLNVEVAMGISKKIAFGLRMRQEPTQPVYFISRTLLEDLTRNTKYAEDAKVLEARAQEIAGGLLHRWFCNSSSRVHVRLFTNTSSEFKMQLVRRVRVRFAAAGSTIQKEGTAADSCICLYIGEATVSVQGKTVSKLTHDSKASAWSAWWGFLEASGTCEMSPASVTAITDCTVWDLTAQNLKELRAEFPAECGFFDKVAVKHVKMLTPFAPDVWQVPVLRECAPQFLQAVSLASSQRICIPGDVVVKQDDRGTEMFVLVRGQCSVYRGAVKVANLSEGNCFGELAVLGISDLRTATIIADTVCDLRVLDRTSLLRALSQFPDESARLQQIAEAHGYSKRIAIQELKHVPAFHVFQEEFIQRLAEHMYEQAFFVGQTLFQQDSEQWHMYVLVRGEVIIEMGKVHVCELDGPCVLGASALVTPGCRSLCGVRCGSICEVLTINTKQVCADLHNEYPEEMERFAELANDLIEEFRSQMLQVFDELSAQDAPRDEEENYMERQDSQDTDTSRTSEPKPDSTPKASKRMSLQLTDSEEAGHKGMADTEKRRSITDSEKRRSIQDFEDGEKRKSTQDFEHCPIRWSNCFFADSDRGFLKKLSSELQKRIYFDGQVMLREGDCGQYALLLHSGVGVVEVGNTRVAEVKRGDFLGEVVLLGFSEMYTATIKAAGLVTAYAIDKHGLREALEDFPDEKNRLEEVMKKRVKLTRQLTKIKHFCQFVGKEDGEQDEEGRRKSFLKGRRSMAARPSLRNSRGSIVPNMVRASLLRRATAARGSVANRGSILKDQPIGASPQSSPKSQTSPRHGGPNMENQGEAVSTHSASDPHPATAGRSSISAGRSSISAGRSSITAGRSSLIAAPALQNSEEDSPASREASASSQKTSAPKLPGRAHGLQWVDRRKEALKFAHWRRKCAQARHGHMTEMLGPSEGYRATKAGIGTPFACFTTAPAAPRTPSSQRLRQAESVYGKPVWHEVFGDPMLPMELPAV